MRPDKAKVVDEVWDDVRIESFLNKSPMGDEASVDYSVLLNAYRSMRSDDFSRFIDKFIASGRDLDACSNAGLTLAQTIEGHRHAAPFNAILDKHA